MSMPGGFESTDEHDSDFDVGDDYLMGGPNGGDTTEDSMEEIEVEMGEEDLLDDDDDDALNEAEDDDELPARGGGGGGQGMQIGYDPIRRQVLIIDSAGRRQSLTSAHLRGSTTTLSAVRRMIAAQVGEPFSDGDDDEGSEDDDDYGWGPTRPGKNYYDPITEPQEAGVSLTRSGEFGRPPPSLSSKARKFNKYNSNLATTLGNRSIDYRKPQRSSISEHAIPNSSGTIVSEYQAKTYIGQYSEDGSFFYAATQDFKVYIYDTRKAPAVGSKSITDSDPTPTASRRSMAQQYWNHRTSLKTTKIIKANSSMMQWTITDVNLSPDNTWLAFSSITPRVHLVKTAGDGGWAGDDQDQAILDFSAGRRGTRNFNIWSLRFSKDAKEIVAGGTQGQIAVYDIEARQTTLRINAHEDDVNAVAFADDANSNLLLSGSDDTFIKVWDRRSLSSERASGVLVGHTEGVTFLASKGDGRYVVSNGKDQTMRLFDLRKMVSDEQFTNLRLDQISFGIKHWDYRQATYAKPAYNEHPHDVSVMRYRGHAVLRTLIRCNFSPIATTGQRYVYSGGSDGKIHIYHLDGRTACILDRSQTHPLINASGEYNDPSDATLRSTQRAIPSRSSSTVRDVSWHPTQPSMMTTAWEQSRGVEGSIAQHEWSGGPVGETMEDQAERAAQEASG